MIFMSSYTSHESGGCVWSPIICRYNWGNDGQLLDVQKYR